MTQDNSQPEGGEHGADEQKPVAPELQALIDLIKADPVRTAEELKKLRAEAKQKREDADSAETLRKAEEIKRLEGDQKWQEANSALKQQLDALAPLAQRVEESDDFLRSLVERRVESLLPHFRNLVPNYDDPRKTLDWLETNAGALRLPATPTKTGAGEQGDGANAASAKLTPEELALAKQAGMTAEQWAQYKAKGKPEGAK